MPLDRLIPLVPQGSSVLDIGCGGGLWLGLLAVLGCIDRGFGFDSCRDAIDVARAMTKNLRASGCTREVIFEHRAVSEEWPQDVFDVVSLIDVLHHIPPEQQRRVVDLACERVRPGGLLFSRTCVSRPRWRATANRLHDLLVSPPVDSLRRAFSYHRLGHGQGASLQRLRFHHPVLRFTDTSYCSCRSLRQQPITGQRLRPKQV